MRSFSIRVALSLASACITILGCEHKDDRAAPGYASTPGRTQAEPAVDHIASARCDREQGCDNIGDGKKYASRDVCMDQLRGSVANDLNSYQCAGGINRFAVQDCLNAIGNEECGVHPVEAISRFEKCRSSAMCLK